MPPPTPGPTIAPERPAGGVARAWRAALGLAAAAGLALLVAWFAVLRPAPGGAQRLDIGYGHPLLHFQAELVLSDSATPPGPQARREPVALPDHWRSAGRGQQGRQGWYRIALPGPPPSEPTSVLLWRFSMNAAVWFNGEFIGDGGSFDEPVARNWNRPLIWKLPAGLWRESGNELWVRLRTYPGFGHLMPVAVGPTRLLMPEFERRHLAQVVAAQVAAGITLLGLVTALLLWAIDRRDTAPLYFAAVCGVWLIYALNAFWRDIPVPAGAWWWAVHSAIDAAYALMLAYAHRQVGVRRPRVEAAAFAYAAACALAYAAVDLPTLAALNPWLHAGATLVGLYLVGWLALHWWRTRTAAPAVLALLFGAVIVVGVHDQVLNALVAPQLWRVGSYRVHLTMPVLFLGVIALLGLRAAAGLRAVRDANQALESRVQAARQEVAQAAARERELLAEARVAAERERIYRDLHDNLGARLLSLVYGARDERQAGAARAALSEMRSLIAAGAPADARLSELLPDWRVECELRCEDAGLALDWQHDGDAALSGRMRYQLERILRELVSNAIEHAGARKLRVAWHAGDAALALVVEDDGRGVADPAALAGHGIAGLGQRAQAIGGRIDWRAAVDGGLRAELQVPLPAVPPGAPA